jgi:hypothetical protein
MVTEESVPMNRPTDTMKVIQGAGRIAEFLYGDETKARSVYHLAKTTDLPVFYLGSSMCAREERLLGWIEARESASRAPKGQAA